MEFKQIKLVKDKMILNKLKELFDVIDYISDTCDDEEITPSARISMIRITANGELAELEELIVELQKELSHETEN